MALKFPLYILAGGKSERFGRDKARAAVGSTPLIVSVARSLESRASSVAVVASHADAYSDLGFRTIGDVVPGCGPAAGIASALRDATSGGDDWVLISGCDWLGLRAEWVDLLAAARDGREVVVFESDRLEPMLGLYHVSIAERLEDHVRNGQLSLQKILPEYRLETLATPEGWRALINANKPQDLSG